MDRSEEEEEEDLDSLWGIDPDDVKPMDAAEDLEEEGEALQDRAEDLEEEGEALQDRAEDLEEEVEALQDRAEDLEEEVEALQDRAEDLEEKNQEPEEEAAMASESVMSLAGAVEFWETAINNGEAGEKISTEAALMAQEEGERIASSVDGWFSSDEEEGLAFWSGLDETCMSWKIRADERKYFADIIAGQLAHRAEADRIAAEVEYSEQVQEKVERAAQNVTDLVVETGKDPSALWGAVGAGLGYAAGTVLGAGVGGPVGAAMGGCVAGFVAGKLKAAGIL